MRNAETLAHSRLDRSDTDLWRLRFKFARLRLGPAKVVSSGRVTTGASWRRGNIIGEGVADAKLMDLAPRIATCITMAKRRWGWRVCSKAAWTCGLAEARR
jgi:hypothetical protein